MPKADRSTVASTTDVTKRAQGETLGVLSALMQAIQTFSGTDGHQTLKCHLEEVESLKSSLNESQSALTSLQKLVTDMSTERAKVLQTADDSKRQVEQLQAAAAELEKKNTTLEDSLSKQKATIDKSRSKVKEQADELKVKSAAVAELEKKLRDAEARADAALSRAAVAEGSNAKLEQKNDTVSRKLDTLQSLSLPLAAMDPSTVADKYAAIWIEIRSFISTRYLEDLPQDVLANDAAWAGLHESGLFVHSFPVPRSNSTTAKSMRMAIIMAIMTKALDTYIFQPSYIFSETSGLRAITLHLAVVDSAKESFARGLLLSIFADSQADARSGRIDDAADYFMSHAAHFDGGAAPEDSRAKVSEIIGRACNVWAEIRALQQRYEPVLKVAGPETMAWPAFTFEASDDKPKNATKQAASQDDEVMLVVTPRLYVIEHGREPRLIAEGSVVRRSQCRAALQEVVSLQSAAPNKPLFTQVPRRRTTSTGTRLHSRLWGGQNGSTQGRFLD